MMELCLVRIFKFITLHLSLGAIGDDPLDYELITWLVASFLIVSKIRISKLLCIWISVGFFQIFESDLRLDITYGH